MYSYKQRYDVAYISNIITEKKAVIPRNRYKE